MNFQYKFLVVGPDMTFCEQAQTQLSEDFPQAFFQVTLSTQDAVDYCQANVFDMIVADNNTQELEGMIQQIRELNNDNLTTGVMVIGEAQSSFPNLSDIMFANTPMDKGNYLPIAKTLLTLKI